jgi:uncharacterized protein DUF4136
MRRRTVITLVLTCLLATAAYAQRVTTDSAPGAPFASYRTFAWTPGTPSPVSLTEQRIHAGVNAQLQARGLMQVDANPDLYVATHVATHTVPQFIATGFGPWWGPGWGGGGVATMQSYTEGTLVVDLYDASTKKMVWRGVATGSVSSRPSRNTRRLDRAIARMFERYPPRTASANN